MGRCDAGRVLASSKPRRSEPSISIEPWSGSNRRSSSAIKVLLPDPVVPTIAVIVPGFTSNSISASPGI